MIFSKSKTNHFKLLLVFISIFITSCSLKSDPNKGNDSSIALKSKPLVLTTFTILADMARNIAGNRIDVASITKLGAEIHGYQPTPSDLIRASKADLIIENGLGLELWAKKFIAASNAASTVVLTQGMTPLLIEGDSYSGKPNPHAWMSPKRAMKYVDNIVSAFSILDPKGSKLYKQNASSYKKELLLLDKELTALISRIPAKRRVLVSCEGAFTYLAKDYGMEEAYLWPVNAESQVTPRRMLNLINTIKEKRIPTIFCESTVSSKAQEEVARASGSKFGGTFYVDSLSGPSGPASTLLELQRHNVRLITEGLAPELFNK
tara:strand:+ start:159 stop:1118 length:960 start_codon:yes stop_codon:yes gene_type:complete